MHIIIQSTMRPLILLVATAVLFVGVAGSAFAQSATTETEPSQESSADSSNSESAEPQTPDGDEETEDGEVYFGEMTLIADVNVENYGVTLQKDNTIYFGFDYVNGEGAQPDVRYAVQLMEPFSEEGDIIVDEFVYDDVLSLPANSRTPMRLTYTAPEYLEGAYRLRLVSENERGMILTAVFLDEEVTLDRTGEYIEILPRTCVARVGEGDTDYALRHGIDLAPEEDLNVTCTIKNNFDVPKGATMRFETKERSLFGHTVAEETGETLQVSAKEERDISFVVPKPEKPQAYSTKVALYADTGEPISNTIVVHYIVQGDSATIRNAQFDKGAYAVGETAKVTFNVAGYADSFYGSRAQEANPDRGLDEAVLSAYISDGETGNRCSDTKEGTFSESELLHTELSFAITADCNTPKVSATLTDTEGKVLDEHAFVLDTPEVPEDTRSTTDSDKGRDLASYFNLPLILILIVLLASGGAYMLFRRRRNGDETMGTESNTEPENDHDDTNNGGHGGPTATLVLACLVFFGGATAVEAASYSIDNTRLPGGHVRGTTYYNFSGGTYAPGQRMRTSMSARSNYCENVWLDLSLRWELRDATPDNVVASKHCDKAGGLQHGRRDCNIASRSDSMNAPTRPGRHRVYFGTKVVEKGPRTYWFREGRNIIVEDPARNGECGAAAGGTYPSAPARNLCNVPSGANPSVSGPSDSNGDGLADEYSWTCPGVGGGSPTSCTANYEPPVPQVNLTNDGPIAYDTTATLDWTVTNPGASQVDRCEATGGPWSGTKASPSGNEVTNKLTEDTSYEITCYNPYGGSGSDNTTVDVIVPTVTGLSLTDQPDPTASGERYTLEWDSQYANDGCSVDYRTRDAGGSYSAWNNGEYSGTSGSETRADTAPAGTDQELEWRLQCTNGNGTESITEEHTVLAPPLVSLEICDSGGSNCQTGLKEVPFDEPTASVRWNATLPNGTAGNTLQGCSVAQGGSDGLNNVSADSGTDDVTVPSVGNTATFQVVCESTGGKTASNEVRLRTEPLPYLETDDYSVKQGEDIDVRWFTEGGNPNSCALTVSNGDQYSSSTSPTLVSTEGNHNGGNPEDGAISIEINNTTDFTLDCENGSNAITVFVIPEIYEE